MTMNEETVPGSNQEKDEKKMADQNGNGWQSVTIGGVTGILMGAGAMYAAEAFATGATPEDENSASIRTEGSSRSTHREEVATSHIAANGLKVAEVDQNLSFGQAFEAARNAVGPGGVFHWHGNIYNTYRLDEWNSMSAGERQQFAQQVQPEIRPGEGHARHHSDVAQNEVKQEEPMKQKPEDVNKPKPEDPHKPEEQQKPEPERPFDPNNPDPDTPNPPDDGKVHMLGFTKVEAEGQEHMAGHAYYNGRHVYLIDIDHAENHEYDIAIADKNQDGKLTMDESNDIRDVHYTPGKMFIDSILEHHRNQVAMDTQDELATEAPDYVNDANPTI